MKVHVNTISNDNLLQRDHAQRRRRLFAIAALALCCVFWGGSFPVAQLAIHPFERELRLALGSTSADLTVPQRVGISAAFNTWRMGLAAALYAVLTIRRQRGFRRPDVIGGLLVGVFFTAGMLTQNIGLRYTLPSVSGFLTALLVVFAPLAQAAIFKQHVGWKTWTGVTLALVGTGVLSWPTGEAAPAVLAPPWPWFGEAITIFGALLFTGQVIAVDRFGTRADPARLTLIMLVTTALLSGAAALLLENRPLFAPATAARLLCDPTVVWTVGCLVLLPSVVALHLMNTYQPAVTPAAAGVLYCLEPVFAVLFSLALGTERLAATVVVGGTIVLLAVLLVAREAPPHPT